MRAVKLIGLYKTREAAAKARELMIARGIGEAQISLLAPEGEGGPRLAAYAASTSAATAWKYGLPAGALTALVGFGLTAGSLELGGSPIEAGLVGALAGCSVGLLFGAAVGALVGRRQHMLRADFFAPDAKRGATALGVLTHDEAENEHARYAFRATGALQIESQADGKTVVPSAREAKPAGGVSSPRPRPAAGVGESAEASLAAAEATVDDAAKPSASETPPMEAIAEPDAAETRAMETVAEPPR